MKTPDTVTSRFFYPRSNPILRLGALWYFTILMTVWVLLGHTVLGFEQAWAAPVVAVGSACLAQWLLEYIDARAKGRTPRYAGGIGPFLNFLPPAIIPGFAVSMLLYPNERLWPIVFAAVLSIASKVLVRAPLPNGQTQHVFNPSNFGLCATFLLFPWVGMAPPYHFTENVAGLWDWAIPGIVLLSGIIIHAIFTGRLPLVAAWIIGFVAQALLRSWLFGAPWRVPLVPMTSAAFIVFTLYMIPDPATTPLAPRRQVWFSLAVAAIYGILQVTHMVFGLFFALATVSAIRGLGMYFIARTPSKPRLELQPAAA